MVIQIIDKNLYFCIALHRKKAKVILPNAAAGIYVSAAFRIYNGFVPCGALMRPLLSNEV